MDKPLLLLETSGSHISVAVASRIDEQWQVLAKAEHTQPMQHTAFLLPTIKAAFAKTHFTIAQTGWIAVSSGPGSYTALRAGLSSAKGICLAMGTKLIMISTLRALASATRQARPGHRGNFLSLLPARRNEVYFATYDYTLAELAAPRAVEISRAWMNEQVLHGPLLASGAGAAKVAAQLSGVEVVPGITLQAANLLELSSLRIEAGEFDNVDKAVPLYIKPPFITQAKPRL